MLATEEREALKDCRELRVRLARCEAQLQLLAGQDVDAALFDVLAKNVTEALARIKRADVIGHRLRQVG
ncbi:MAG TPA: hypothetical protein VKA66_21435 [Mycobacterium sp.]|nr:hypothetical protein [Mycobacterium sp.]